MLHAVARVENRGVEFVVLPNLHRTFASVRRNHQPQLSALLRIREILLIVRRCISLFVRKHPDLVKVHGFGLRGVELRMRHACSSAHVLHVARFDYGTVAHAVLVRQRSFQNIGHDLHVAMRVRRESAATGYAVVIHYAQGAKLYVFRIVIISERKSEAGIEPAVIGMAAVVALANVDHHGLQNSTA